MPFTKETARAAITKRWSVTDRKEKTFLLKMTPEEYDYIKEKAAEAAMSRTAYIVRAAISYKDE